MFALEIAVQTERNPHGSFLGGGCLNAAAGRAFGPQISLEFEESQDSRLVLLGLSLEPGQQRGQRGQRDPQVARLHLPPLSSPAPAHPLDTQSEARTWAGARGRGA